MIPIKAKFRLVATERATVKLSQVREDAMTANLTLVLNAQEAKMFNDAEIGAEFEIAISPL